MNKTKLLWPELPLPIFFRTRCLVTIQIYTSNKNARFSHLRRFLIQRSMMIFHFSLEFQASMKMYILQHNLVVNQKCAEFYHLSSANRKLNAFIIKFLGTIRKTILICLAIIKSKSVLVNILTSYRAYLETILTPYFSKRRIWQ